MPSPALSSTPAFQPAALPVGVQDVMEPLATGIEELRLPPSLEEHLPQPAEGWSAWEGIQEQQRAGGTTASSLPALLLAAKRTM